MKINFIKSHDLTSSYLKKKKKAYIFKASLVVVDNQ